MDTALIHIEHCDYAFCTHRHMHHDSMTRGHDTQYTCTYTYTCHIHMSTYTYTRVSTYTVSPIHIHMQVCTEHSRTCCIHSTHAHEHIHMRSIEHTHAAYSCYYVTHTSCIHTYTHTLSTIIHSYTHTLHSTRGYTHVTLITPIHRYHPNTLMSGLIQP